MLNSNKSRVRQDSVMLTLGCRERKMENSLFKNNFFTTKDILKDELYDKCEEIWSNFLLQELELHQQLIVRVTEIPCLDLALSILIYWKITVWVSYLELQDILKEKEKYVEYLQSKKRFHYAHALLQGGGKWEVSLSKNTFFNTEVTLQDKLYDKCKKIRSNFLP